MHANGLIENCLFARTWWFSAWHIIISANSWWQWLAFSDSRERLRVHFGLHSDYLRCLSPTADQHPVNQSISDNPDTRGVGVAGHYTKLAVGVHAFTSNIPSLSAPPPLKGYDPTVICVWPGCVWVRSSANQAQPVKMTLTCDWEDGAYEVMSEGI